MNVTTISLGSGGSPCPGSSLAGLRELQGRAPSGCTELRFLLQPHWHLVPLSLGLPEFPALESAVLQVRQACSGLWHCRAALPGPQGPECPVVTLQWRTSLSLCTSPLTVSLLQGSQCSIPDCLARYFGMQLPEPVRTSVGTSKKCTVPADIQMGELVQTDDYKIKVMA